MGKEGNIKMATGIDEKVEKDGNERRKRGGE